MCIFRNVCTAPLQGAVVYLSHTWGSRPRLYHITASRLARKVPGFKPPEKRVGTAEETMSRLIGEDANLCPKCRKGHMTKVLELRKPKIMQRRVRIVVIDSS